MRTERSHYTARTTLWFQRNEQHKSNAHVCHSMNIPERRAVWLTHSVLPFFSLALLSINMFYVTGKSFLYKLSKKIQFTPLFWCAVVWQF